MQLGIVIKTKGIKVNTAMTNAQLDQYLSSVAVNHEGYRRTRNARFCPDCDSRIPDDFVTGQLGKPCPQCETVIHVDGLHNVRLASRVSPVREDAKPTRAKAIVAIDKDMPILPSSISIPTSDTGFHAAHCIRCRKGITETLSSSLVKMLVEYIKMVRHYEIKGVPYVKTIRIPKFVTGRACKECSPESVETTILQHTPGTPLPDGYEALAVGDIFLVASVEPVKDTLPQSTFEDASRDNDRKTDDEALLDSRWVNKDGIIGTLNGEELLSKEQLTKSRQWLIGNGKGCLPDIPKRKKRFPRRPVLERQYVNDQGIVVRRYKAQ